MATHRLLTAIAAAACAACIVTPGSDTHAAERDFSDAPPIFSAVQSGDVSLLGRRLGAGDDPDMRWRGMPLLSLAVLNGGCDSGIVERLLEVGADPALEDTDTGGNALLAAVNLDDPDCIRLLVRHGADPSAPVSGGHTALHQAVGAGYLDALHALLESGADVDRRDGGGLTPLMLAVTTGDSRPVRALLDAGADPCLRDRSRRDVATLAAAAGQPRIADRLPPCD